MPRPVHRPFVVALTAAASLLAACATGPRVDAQWSDPQLRAGLLHGAKVLVACEAYEPVVKQLCLDQMRAEVIARGASVVPAPEVANSTPGRPVGDEQLLSAARAAGASAVWATTMQIGDATSPAGSGVSVGLGGFGGGSHVGGGIGISLPIGGAARSENGYVADSRLLEAGGRLLWTARASTPPSSDVNAQVGDLARTISSAADKSGLF